MYKRILVAIDASPCHEKVLREALELALLHDASLTFLHVVEDPTVEVYGRRYGQDLHKEYLQAGNETLNAALERARAANVPAKTLVVDKQHPADAILEAEEDHDLTILGTHGRTGIRRMVLGSVTEELIKRSVKPHLVVSCSD